MEKSERTEPRKRKKKWVDISLFCFFPISLSLSLFKLLDSQILNRYFGFNAQNYCSFFSTALLRPFHGIVSHYAGIELKRKRIKNSLRYTVIGISHILIYINGLKRYKQNLFLFFPSPVLHSRRRFSAG
jgi:hypothetical protein